MFEFFKNLKNRDQKHVRDILLGNKCGHRKYGECYNTYSTIKSFWVVKLFGEYRSINFFGFLKECDMCGKQMIRFPSWEPPIIKDEDL